MANINLLVYKAHAVEYGISGVGGNTFGEYISSIYNYSLGIGGTLATLVIIYAGILYMTSQGESSKLQAAKDYFIGAITGLVLLLLLGLVLGFLGVPSYGT